MENDIKFWDEYVKEDRNGNGRTTLSFNYVGMLDFLQQNGFYKSKIGAGQMGYIRILRSDSIKLENVDRFFIIDFIKNHCRTIGRLDVLNMILRGVSQYLSVDKLNCLDTYTFTSIIPIQP